MTSFDTLQCTVNGDDSAVFHFLSLVTMTLDFDIQTRPSEGPHIFHVNLVQICSVVPEILEAQTKKVTDGAKTELHLRAVII